MSELRKNMKMRRLVIQEVIAKKLSWGGHVENMSEERLLKQVKQHAREEEDQEFVEVTV